MQINIEIKGGDDMKEKLEQAINFLKGGDILEIIGVEAINHFKQSFEDEGFTDKSLDKWDTRKSKRLTRNEQKTLSDTGELAESIDYRVEGNTVIIYSDKPYAQIHNEGGEITVTPKMRSFFIAKHYEAKEAGNTEAQDMWQAMFFSDKITIPKRQFIGDSEMLNVKIKDKITRELDNIFKS
ncbi:MAG: hypothetical protein RJA25_419 [Bacteroidota bacterium]|jgi:phage gpG-like protein